MIATMKSNEELFEHLTSTLEGLRYDNEAIKRIKTELRKYKILPGKIVSVINNPELLQEFDRDLLYLFTNAVYVVSGNASVHPEDYFNDREIKEIITNFEGDIKEQLEFPYTFEDVNKGAEDNYLFYSDFQTVKELYENKLLQYNFETQREARQRATKTGSIIEIPKVIETSVKQIEKLIINNQIDISVLTFNARLGSSDEDEELIYDENKRALTVTKGTLLDVLDGFHRINGIVRALRKYPNINKPVIINIVNYDKKRAKDKFVQINTTNPVGRGHKKRIAEARQADFIAKRVQDNTDLRNLVSASDRIYSDSNLLLSFNTLSDAIDEVYNVEDKREAIKESDYLIKFFEELLMYNYDAFVSNIVEIRKNSLINVNTAFYGYILLSKRMKDENIELSKLSSILDTIDFSRENKMWQKAGVINDSLNVVTDAKRQFYKFFEKIKLS